MVYPFAHYNWDSGDIFNLLIRKRNRSINAEEVEIMGINVDDEEI